MIDLIVILNLAVAAAALYFQVADVRTTRQILDLGGYEKNKWMADLQAGFPVGWGRIKVGVVGAVIAIAGALAIKTLAMLGLTLPLLAIGWRTVRANRKVIDDLTPGGRG